MSTHVGRGSRSLAGALGAALLGLGAVAAVAGAQPGSTPAAGTPTAGGSSFDPNAAVATPVARPGPGREVAVLNADHVLPDEPHAPYNSVPPTSGQHWPIWAEWGVYDEPIPDEVQVHNLEHGGVVLQYRCSCPEAVAILERFADARTGYPVLVIAAPYPGMEAEVAFTAWGRIQELAGDEVTPETVRAFVEAFVDQGPEKIHTTELAAWRESDAPKP